MAERFNSFGDLGKAQGITSASTPSKPGGSPQGPVPPAGSALEMDFFKQDYDYVTKAEDIMKMTSKKLKDLYDRKRKRWDDRKPFGELTTSKIRNILSLLNGINNQLLRSPENELTSELADKIRYAKVRIAYEAGRTEDVKVFVDEAKLIELIGQIGKSKVRFNRFAKYLEALVAYHRYLGGDDK